MPKHIAEGVVITGTLGVGNAVLPSDSVNVATLTRAGFPNRVDSTFTFNTGTRTLSLTATGSSFEYWVNNQRYTITGTQIILPAATGSEQYVFFNSSGTLTSSNSPWLISSDQAAPVALVYWGMTGASATLADERHSAYRDRYNHRYLHNTRGTAYDNGLSGTFFAGTSGTFSISSGRIWDEDIDWNITGSVTNARFWIRSGSAMLFRDGATSAFSGATNAPFYDLNGVPTPVTNTDYFNAWFYATTEYDYPISIVMGQNQYTSLAAAGAGPEPSIPGRSTREWKLLYKAIYQLQGGTTTFQSSTDYRGSVTLPGQGTANTLPATQITYLPTAPLTSNSVQGALDQVASLVAYGGLHLDAGLAVSGGAGDPQGALTSGTWTVISASGRLSASEQLGVSASISNGRLYITTPGVYFINANVSIEAVGNPVAWSCHVGIFTTGTEDGAWSTAMDMAKDISTELSVQAIKTLPSGSYIDLRVRASDTVPTLTTHHYQFLAHKVG